jgi:threonine dehydratase
MSTEILPSLRDIERAAEHVHGRVRHTPVIHAAPLKHPVTGANLYIKLENLQISGSFKARGAINKLAHLSREEIARGLVTASGGNHGLAVAYAGWLFNVPATVYLPANAPMIKETNLNAWGATVKRVGEVWDEANVAALQEARETGATYIHPFDDPQVIAGQGTLALEVLHDLHQLDALVIAIGGGGLISGAAIAAKAIKPGIKVIGVEPTGAPTLYESVRAGQLVTLEHITTKANTLAPRRSSQINLDIISEHVDEIVLVTDDEMRSAAQWLWREMGIGVELSSAAAVAALLNSKVALPANANVCAVVCSAGTDGM